MTGSVFDPPGGNLVATLARISTVVEEWLGSAASPNDPHSWTCYHPANDEIGCDCAERMKHELFNSLIGKS